MIISQRRAPPFATPQQLWPPLQVILLEVAWWCFLYQSIITFKGTCPEKKCFLKAMPKLPPPHPPNLGNLYNFRLSLLTHALQWNLIRTGTPLFPQCPKKHFFGTVFLCQSIFFLGEPPNRMCHLLVQKNNFIQRIPFDGSRWHKLVN